MKANAIEPSDLRAHLLDVEPPDVARLQRLQQEIDTVFTKELSRTQRIRWWASLAFAAANAVFGGYILAHMQGTPGHLKVIWSLYTGANVFWAVYSALVLRRGTFDWKQFERVHRTTALVPMVIAVVLTVYAATHPSLSAVGWAMFGLIFVGTSLARRVMNRVVTAELTVREAMLRLELQLAEMSEADEQRPASR